MSPPLWTSSPHPQRPFLRFSCGDMVPGELSGCKGAGNAGHMTAPELGKGVEMEGIVPYLPERAKEYVKKGYWLQRAVGEVFDETASRYPDKEILVSEESRWTYADLSGAVERLALSLLCVRGTV